MPTIYEQICDTVLTGNLRPADFAKQIVSLSPAERTSLESLLSDRARRIGEVLKLSSTLPFSAPAPPIGPGSVRMETGELSLGDIVRSNDQHWLSTGQHLSGAIVRFEQVPESQVPVVGSHYWAYLNSDASPIGLAALEKVCSEGKSLENFRAALGTSTKVEIMAGAESAVAVSETSKV